MPGILPNIGLEYRTRDGVREPGHKESLKKQIFLIFSLKIDCITLDPDPDPNWAKILDPDPNSMYLDPQH